MFVTYSTNRLGIYLLHMHPNDSIYLNFKLSFLVSGLTKAENLSPSLRHPLCPFSCKGERVPIHHKKIRNRASGVPSAADPERGEEGGGTWEDCCGGAMPGAPP